MNFGKGGSTTYSSPQLTDEQKQQIALQNKFASETVIPTYQTAVKGATDLYNWGQPGVTNAAQNLAGAASQAQKTLGETGESAVRTGISGLESLFSPEYAQEQLNAAMAPAQAQYQQNLTNQEMQFGGTGNLGSARQALAGRQLAGQTQSAQAATAANILKDITAQRAGAASQLAQLGQAGIGQGLGAAGQQVSAAMTPQQLYNQYASVIFGTPGQSYGLGPYGQSGSTDTTKFGINI